MGDLNGNLVPSVTNFNIENSKKTKKQKLTKNKGQHHPGMTVAEMGLQGVTEPEPEKENEEEPEVRDSVPHSSVLTSLGDLVRNVTNTAPFFM